MSCVRWPRFATGAQQPKSAKPHAPREHFAHGADIGIRGIRPTRGAVFEQAAIALTAIVTDLADVAVPEPVAIDCDAARDDLLLVDWLDRLIRREGASASIASVARRRRAQVRDLTTLKSERLPDGD
jgi:SHS2 domain-containing protein